LRIFKNRSLDDIFAVDDSPLSFSLNLDNGVPIIEYKGNKKDNELKSLAKYLLAGKDCEDVRQYNYEKLKLLEISLEKSSHQ